MENCVVCWERIMWGSCACKTPTTVYDTPKKKKEKSKKGFSKKKS